MSALSIDQTFQLALKQHQAGAIAQAQSMYEQVIARQPDHAGALLFLGVIEHQLGRNDAALKLMQRSLAIQPQAVQSWANLATVLSAMGRFDEASDACRRVIALNPRNPESHANLANILLAAQRFEEALTACRHAIDLSPHHAVAHRTMGHCLVRLEKFDEALAAYEQALAINPNLMDLQNNLGNLLRSRGDADRALAAYEKAIAHRPDVPDSHLNLAGLLLARGDFRRGWQEMEWRWSWSAMSAPQRRFTQPQWNGEPLAGRTLLLHPEQGFGDSMQFVRYLPLIAALGGQIILESPRQLLPLFSRLPADFQLIPAGEPLPPFDLHCPLMSLPAAFATDLSTIPATVPYLQPDPAESTKWQSRLAALPPGPKIGLAWAGNPANKRDKTRSMPFSELTPLLQLPALTFFSLQKGTATEQARALPPSINLIDWSEEFANFNDAALIVHLDLVITVDTSIAHLAGALGRPTWVMLSLDPDWRWMRSRPDTPWYPTIRLFRQPSRGDWDSVINQIASELKSLPV
jgi:tetratricopeptide (TPR) repeat protein